MKAIFIKKIFNSKKIVLLYLCLFLSSTSQIEASDSKTYYVKYNIETENGSFSGSSLSMLPAVNEFRVNNFKVIKVTGKSSKNATVDSRSSAQHNAITNLLKSHGLQSIKNNRALFNLILREKTVMSYEGVIRHPYTILNQGYLEDESVYFIKMEVAFSPISFPDKWSYLYIKKKILDMLSAMVSIFK